MLQVLSQEFHHFISQRAPEYVVDLNELHEELHVQMTAAQKQYQAPADHQQQPAPDFHIGQNVFVSAEHIHTNRPAKKLLKNNLDHSKS